MRVSELIGRSAVAVTPDTTVRAAAEIMDQAGVGALGVVDGGTLVGMVTDRDLVRRVLARGLPGDARVDAVMSNPVITVDADADAAEAIALFSRHAVRRLGVVSGGAMVGVLAVDDLLVLLSEQLAAVVGPVTVEVAEPQHDSLTPARD